LSTLVVLIYTDYFIKVFVSYFDIESVYDDPVR